MPTQGESIVRGSGDDDSRGVQLMERSKPPADIDYLAVRHSERGTLHSFLRLDGTPQIKFAMNTMCYQQKGHQDWVSAARRRASCLALACMQELIAIQQNGPKELGFFGTRNMGFLHQNLIEILSYAMVLTVRDAWHMTHPQQVISCVVSQP